MRRDRDLVATARSALAAYLGDGRLGWGQPLPASELAADLNLSPTPVREALAHLAGEGLINHCPGRGYFAPCPTPPDIEELYALHRLLIKACLDAVGPRSVEETPSADTDTPEAVFARLAAMGANRLVAQEQARVAARLAPIRRVEGVAAPLSPAIGAALARAQDAGDLAAAVERYHDDRMAASSAVFTAMRSGGVSIKRI